MDKLLATMDRQDAEAWRFCNWRQLPKQIRTYLDAYSSVGDRDDQLWSLASRLPRIGTNGITLDLFAMDAAHLVSPADERPRKCGTRIPFFLLEFVGK